ASFLTGGAVCAGVSAALLYGRRDGGVPQGIAQLVVAAVYVAVAAARYRRARESARLLLALGLALAAIGLAEALSGSSLTYAWAAEAALLVWLSSRVRDARFQLPALAYLALALVYSLVTEARPDHLSEPIRHPASGAPALMAIALAALVFARVKRSWADDDRPPTGFLRALDPLLAWLRTNEAAVNVGMYSLAAIVAAYAASLGILELCQDVWPGNSIETPFEWGHVAVDSAWALAGLAVVLGSIRRRSNVGLALGFGWLALTVAKAVAFDVVTLAQTRYGIAFAVVGAAVLLAGLAVKVNERRLQIASLVYLAFGALLTLAEEAPPTHLLVSRAHPGHGVPSLLLVIAATAVLAWSLSWNERYRLQAIWVAGGLAVYAASLSILEAMQRISNQGVDTDFQRGHTVVSAFWGLLALVSLYVGLNRKRILLRVGGFILFAIS